MASPNDSGLDHLAFANAVIEAIGRDNLLWHGGGFWRWNDTGLWMRVDDRDIKQAAQEMYPTVRCQFKFNGSVSASILDIIKTSVYRRDQHEKQKYKCINCANGELRLNSGRWELGAHERAHFHTSQIPVVFDSKAQAPLFLRFLADSFRGDADGKEKAMLVLEMMGYSLLTSCEYEKFILLIGSGANGKSVLMHTVSALVGKPNTTAVQPSRFDNPHHRAHLHGKLVNIVTEIAEGAEISDAQLKAIVSGELTTADHKFQAPFDFHPFATCWFGTNHLPHTRDFSDALFRRAVIVQFNNKFVGSSADPHLAHRLTTELQGILNLALLGLSSLFRRGCFTEPTSSVAAKLLWRKEADQAAQYVEDRCTLSPGSSAPSQLIYSDYRCWADEQGIKRQLSQNTLTTRLERLGVTRARSAGGRRMLLGIGLAGAVARAG